MLLLSHNPSAGALGTGDAAGPASICSWELRVKAPLNQTSTDSSYAAAGFRVQSRLGNGASLPAGN